MEFSYTLNRSELGDALKYVLQDRPLARRVRLLLWIILPLALGVQSYLATEKPFPRPLLMGVGMAIIIAVIVPIVQALVNTLFRILLLQINTLRGGMSNTVRLLFSDETIKEVMETKTSEARWEDVRAAHQVGDLLIIYINAWNAAILPRRACGSDGEFQSVVDFVQSRIGKRFRREAN